LILANQAQLRADGEEQSRESLEARQANDQEKIETRSDDLPDMICKDDIKRFNLASLDKANRHSWQS